jgi:coatomer subunit zeta
VTNTGDIILYDGRLAVYKHSLDLIFYLIANQDENELMINTALSAFSDAVHMLLRNQVEKRAVLENLDLVLLCLDETIDEGYVTPIPRTQSIPTAKNHSSAVFVLSLTAVS